MPEARGPVLGRLSRALRDAFQPARRLDELLQYELDKRREDIAFGDDYSSRVFEILQAAESGGWTEELVTVALRARPSHPGLLEVAQWFGLTSLPRDAESVIAPELGFSDITEWRSTLGVLETQVCQVRLPGSGGTGFLVGPDRVLTNYHVIERVISGAVAPADVILRFDYKLALGGPPIPGIDHRLMDDWLVASSEPSRWDDAASPSADPDPDHLDYALLRVADRPGDQPISKFDDGGARRPRGWIEPPDQADLNPGRPLLVLQHPQLVPGQPQAPLKLAIGSLLGFSPNRTRLRHQVNTQPGSSGSPCFTADLELVGLHHYGNLNARNPQEPQYNSAIAITAIRAQLARHHGGVGAFSGES